MLVAKTPDIRAERLRRLVQIEREFDALPVDDDVADGYGRLASAVVLEGRNPRARSMDLLIAATAYATARAFTRAIPPTSSAWLTSSTSSRSERPRSLPFRQTSIDRRGWAKSWGLRLPRAAAGRAQDR